MNLPAPRTAPASAPHPGEEEGATVTPVEFIDFQGLPSHVLHAIGRLYERGELVRTDPAVYHPDGTVTTRAYVTHPTRVLELPPGSDWEPTPTFTPTLRYRPRPRRKGYDHRAETVGAVVVPVGTGVLLGAVWIYQAQLVAIAATIVTVAVAIAALMVVLSLIGRASHGSCPGVRVHCWGCPR